MKFKNTITCSIPPNMKILFRGKITESDFFIVIEDGQPVTLRVFIGESAEKMKETPVNFCEENVYKTLTITTRAGIFCLPTRKCRASKVEQATFQGKEITIHE